MLVKEICKKCVEERRGIKENCQPVWKYWTNWVEEDERRWCADKLIWCRNALIGDDHPIYEIPEKCLYKLEHIVLNEIK